ncbi:MAG TPA: diguanylate cyclase [Geobacterales bacterium]|nr:diguanylate cyclase [Geobacterales bacterium]
MTETCRTILICRRPDLAAELRGRLAGERFAVTVLTAPERALGHIYSDPPALMLVVLTPDDPIMLHLVRSVKEDCFFSTVPVVGFVDTSAAADFDWELCPLDDFILMPVSDRELLSRLEIARRRLERIFDNNPLTRLPGNTSIQRAIERALGHSLAVCYADLNNFKPFNDVYGFARGDEVLRMLGRVIFNTVRESGGGFTGHIGGDDFVFIVPTERAEEVSRLVIDRFMAVVAELFDQETLDRGYFVGCNRRGEVEHIPLLALAVGVVPVDRPTITHAGKVAEVAAELKKEAKRREGSFCLVDRRG